MAIVSAKGVSKWYGNVIGLNNFNMEVRSGITGIVGPNGAGKSTFFKLLVGTIRANMGEMLVMGKSPWKNPSQLRGIGFCPDYEYLPADLTGVEFLNLAGGLHGLSGQRLASRTAEVLRMVEMTDARDRRMGGYSKGMKQRMKIAGAILHDPKLLLLDEPLSGTDPVVRKELIDMIKALNKDHGHDIIVSSHVLFEVERMTHEVALLYKGRAVATGDISEIRGLMSNHPHHIVIEGQGLVGLAKSLLDRPFTVSVHLWPDRSGLTAEVSRPDELFDSMPSLISETGCQVDSMRSLDDDLESLFKYLAGW
ncbi:MAG: ABC transporter ATP-binding protein [Methanomassiliicoccales archaeon]|jgi:ABC-2 type transport system ATP-binding protein|nr:ABC transporter ATP-binding protein [Methanomassiliicoccales archaeon]